MRLFEISNRGLAVISLLVAVLWGVIFMERSLNARAEQDYQEMRRALPISQPAPEVGADTIPDIGELDWS